MPNHTVRLEIGNLLTCLLLLSVVFSNSFLALCSSDKSKLEVIQFVKGTLSDISHKKLSSLELKVLIIRC